MRDGFDRFATAETPRLLGLAFALTGNPHDAWDLVQESLYRADRTVAPVPRTRPDEGSSSGGAP